MDFHLVQFDFTMSHLILFFIMAFISTKNYIPNSNVKISRTY